jgi:hypothetical protein
MNYRKFTPVFGLISLFFLAAPAFSQTEEDSGYDNYYDYENPDSSEGYDEYDPYYFEEKNDAPKKPEKKPYVRIEMPYDTITELITYTEVVEQEEEYSYIDSLYLRTKKYLIQKFKLNEKDFKESAASMEKISLTLNMPYLVQRNKYVAEPVGQLEFKLTFRFKDYRYKYLINNLKHNLPPGASGSREKEYVYLEYYMRSDKNIIGNDRLLRAANHEINKLIKEFKKFLKDPVIIDEDDW